MNTSKGTLAGSLCVAALVAAGIWHAADPEMLRWPLAPFNAAGKAPPQFTVNRACWSPDGQSILSLSRGDFDALGRLALHDTAQTGNNVPIDVAADNILCAALAPDGRHVLVGTGCGRLIWTDLRTAELVTLVELHFEDFFSATAIADDGRRVAGASSTGSIYLSDPAGQNSMILTADRKSAIADVRFSRDGAKLLSAQLDGTVTTWDLATGKRAQEFAGHNRAAMAAEFFSDGNRIISAGLDDTIRIWDTISGHELWRANLGLFGVKAMAISPDGATAACAGLNRKIVVWDLQRAEKTFDITTPAAVIFDLDFSPDGMLLAAAGSEGTIRIYDAQTGIERKGIEISQTANAVATPR